MYANVVGWKQIERTPQSPEPDLETPRSDKASTLAVWRERMTENAQHTSIVLDLMDSIIAKADALQGDLLALSDLPVERGKEQSIATCAGKFAALVEHVSEWAESEAYVPGDGDWRDWGERFADGDAHTVTVPAATIEYFTHGPYPQSDGSIHDTNTATY